MVTVLLFSHHGTVKLTWEVLKNEGMIALMWVQVQCMIQGAQGWCTGMTQRDGMGIQDAEHIYTRGGFMSMCGKTNTVL